MTQELTMNQADELSMIKKDLQLAQHQAEILQLKHKLEKAQAIKVSKLEDSLFSEKLMAHYEKVSEKLAESGSIPTVYRGKPKDIFTIIAMGYEVGFSVMQALQYITPINGRPCIWGDGLLALILNSSHCQDIQEVQIKEKDRVIGYTCTVIRKGHAPHSQTFTLQDAEQAGLLKRGGASSPWALYPTRMLQWRARGWACRDKFADVLNGMGIAEEERDKEVLDGEFEVIFEKNDSQTNKLKKLLQNSSTEPKKDAETAKSKAKDSEENVEKGPATEEQITHIKNLMEIKEFTEERIKKALDYYKVGSLNELTNVQADAFLKQLGKG